MVYCTKKTQGGKSPLYGRDRMIETVLTNKNVRPAQKIAVKSLISAGLIALAVLLPQAVHAYAGAAGGARWLPMYLPVLLGGCLLGPLWGLGVGVCAPCVSFLLTLAVGNPMPAVERLPYMLIELGVYASVAGAFSRKIAKNACMAVPAAICAVIAGRGVFLLTAFVAQSFAPVSASAAWAQIRTGWIGAVLQIVLVPLLAAALSALLRKASRP